MIRFGGKIPISIYPTFWLIAGLIGYLNTQNVIGTLIWMGVITVSILFHEFGHALTALLFGQKPRIELVALGGLTYHDGAKVPFWKQFFIILDGPLFGFILFGIAMGLLQVPQLSQGITGIVLNLTAWINLVWTIVNLLPVIPLDGGQLLRVVLEKIFGIKGFKYTLIVGMVAATLASLCFFLLQQFIVGAFFFLIAFQSYDTWRRSKHFGEADRSDRLKRALAEAEEAMQQGEVERATSSFEEIRSQAKEGMIYALATQYLALLKYQSGQEEETYRLLLPFRKELTGEPLCILHKTAFGQRDFPVVVELSAGAYQVWPTPQTALFNAFAHGELKESAPAIGWLQTAISDGLENVQEILKESHFDPIRSSTDFQSFISQRK